MILTLFQPDIPQNTGSMIRLAACMGVSLHIIEPCGFPFDDKKVRRASMDYYDHAQIIRHSSWSAFLDFRQNLQHSRLLLLSAHASTAYTNYSYQSNDVLLLGSESAGVPEYVKAHADAGITIPMQRGVRSLNVALAASMVLGEAIRQTRG